MIWYFKQMILSYQPSIFGRLLHSQSMDRRPLESDSPENILHGNVQ